MNIYEQEIELISKKMDKLEDKLQDESTDITYNRRKQIDKWTFECLEKYVYFLIKLNNSTIKNVDDIIQTFHKSMDGCLNLTNFHTYLKKNEMSLRKLFYSDSDLQKAYSDFIEQVKKEPPNTKIMYREIYDPDDLQKLIKKEINKLKNHEKIRKDFLNLFCDESYYEKVDNFFKNMYEYCNSSEQYRIPKHYYADFIDTCINTIEYEFDDGDDEKKAKKIKETLTTNNKLFYLETLFTFLLYPTEYLLNYLYEEITYPILEKCKVISKWETEVFYGEHKYIDKTKNKDIYENKYGVNKLIKSHRPSDRGYRYSEKTIDFFVNNNNSSFFKDTNDFINVYNKFFLGKVEKKGIVENDNKNLSEKQHNDLGTIDAILDYYHMQNEYKSIDSLFRFHRVERSYLEKKIEENKERIKNCLQEKYAQSDYPDIPALFEDIIKNQKYFFTVISNNDSINDIEENYEKKEYFEEYKDISNDIKKVELALSSKFSSYNFNTLIKNYEAVVYNTAARLLDPHFSEKEKEVYFKQLTIFFPEVYNFY